MGIIQTTKELRPRDKADHYPTPYELCRAALNIIPDTESITTVLDPGAGAGVWGEQARKRWPNIYLTGVEMDNKWKQNGVYDQWKQSDFLSFHLDSMRPPVYDLIMGNPPYGVNADGTRDRNLAEKFIRIGWDELREGGYMCLLLRMGFRAGQKRTKRFWPKHPLKDFYVLGRRPSFTGDQRTDATEYAIYLWQKGYNGPTYLKDLFWEYDNECSDLMT
jgi:predicted RNA methylase